MVQPMTIDRLLFAAVALALASVVMLDDNFADNLWRAVNGLPMLPINPWAAGLSAAFTVAAVAALCREWRR
jgi:hypothetical protein